jgi:hypothetical protein
MLLQYTVPYVQCNVGRHTFSFVIPTAIALDLKEIYSSNRFYYALTLQDNVKRILY